MSQLSELVAMESQISALRESIQKSYSTVEFADYEISDFVSAMVENINQPECLQALARLEQVATENNVKLSDIAVGVTLPATGTVIIHAEYVDSYYSDDRHARYYELDICTTIDNVIDGIYGGTRYVND